MGRFLKNKMWALMSKMVIKMEAVMNRIMMKMEASHETNEDIDQVADGIDNIDENTDIYSGVWRRVMGVEIKHRMMKFMWSQSFVSGAIHWIAYDVVANGSGFRSLLVSFSIADEVFGEIMLPDALVGAFPTNLSVMLFEESLAIVKYGWKRNGASCEVWVMKQYGVLESWSRLYRIRLVPGMGKVV